MIKNILLLSGSNLLGPFLVFLTTPILSRLYTPEAMGEYFWVVTLAMMLSIAFGVQIYNQIISSRDFKEASLQLYVNTMLAFVMASLLGIIVAIFFYAFELDGSLAILVALFVSINQVFMMYMSRLSKVNVLVVAGVLRAVLATVFPVIAGVLYGSDSDFLVASYVISEVGVMICFLLNGGLEGVKIGYKQRVLWYEVLVKGFSFAKYTFPSLLFSNFSNSLVVFIIKLESLALLGLYSMLYRLIGTPIYSVGNAVKTLFYAQLMKVEGGRGIVLVTLAFFIYLFAFLFSFFYYSFDYDLVEIILGESWEGVDEYVPFFCLWFAASLANMLPVEVLKHSDNQKVVLKWEVLSGLLKIFSLLFYYFFDIGFDLLIWIPLVYFFVSVIGTAFLMKKALRVMSYED